MTVKILNSCALWYVHFRDTSVNLIVTNVIICFTSIFEYVFNYFFQFYALILNVYYNLWFSDHYVYLNTSWQAMLKIQNWTSVLWVIVTGNMKAGWRTVPC